MAGQVTSLGKVLLLYTMTSGLGDYIVMGDLMHKVETLVPGSSCLMAHRGNPHVDLWPYDDPSDRFFDVYKPYQLSKLIRKLRRARKEGFTVFGLQMAPGSIQGFFFHIFLKRLKVLDFIVDFNLINADIITPPRGDYILDLHLNQISDLLKVQIPGEFYKLSLPLRYDRSLQSRKAVGKFLVGIHPWSRRGHLSSFVWTFEKWKDLIELLLRRNYQVVVFGKDERFDGFRNYVESKIDKSLSPIDFLGCRSVQELIKVVDKLDLIVTVNTGVIHIGYALGKNMVILSGPSLDIWTPKKGTIKVVYDIEAHFPGSDRWIDDPRFGRVDRIGVNKVTNAVLEITQH